MKMSYLYRMFVAEDLEEVKEELGPATWAWQKTLPANFMTSLNIEGVGDIKIPISQKNIKRIKEHAKLCILNGECEWQAQLKNLPAPTVEHITTLTVGCLSEETKNTPVELRLSHLALCSVPQDTDYESESDDWDHQKTGSKKGPLATVLLKLPAANTHRGGDIEVTHKGQSVGFNTSNHSSSSMVIFSSDCHLVQHPVTRGSLVQLVLHLHLKAGPSSTPDHLPQNRIWQNPTPALIDASSRFTTKQEAFARRFEAWKKTAHSGIELFAIPLDHEYSKSTLSFRALKGVDRKLVSIVQSLLGSFVEIHLAVLHKYIGYNEDDWATFGKRKTRRVSGKKDTNFSEKDWTDYLAGNFIDQADQRLELPPLSITVPDELLGIDEQVFSFDSSDPNVFRGACAFDGQLFKRSALIIWPRNQTLTIALCFGLDEALEVVEFGARPESPCHPHEPIEEQLNLLLAYARKHPLEAWFASTRKGTCSDLRCFRAKPNPFAIASQRVARLLDLCVRWKLRSPGLELLKILGTDLKEEAMKDCFCCYGCVMSTLFPSDGILFIGGVYSDAVAASLAKLIALLGWKTPELKNLVSRLFVHYPDQFGPLCHLAVSLHHLKSYTAARFVSTEACKRMEQMNIEKLFKLNGSTKAVTSCIEMFLLLKQDHLNAFLLLLQKLAEKCTLELVASFHLAEPTLLKDLPEFREFYVKLCSKLEADFNEPSRRLFNDFHSSDRWRSNLDSSSFAASRLMTSFLWLQDAQVLREFLERCCQPTLPGKRNILPDLLSSRSTWMKDPNPLADTALKELIAARIQQLRRFKAPIIQECWEQPDAVLEGFPQVENFLRSGLQVGTFDGFADQQQTKALATKLTRHAEPKSGYSVRIVDMGGLDGNAFIKIEKTPLVAESLKQEVKALEEVN